MADRNLTQGPISRLIVSSALPVLASFALQSVYALVNLFFVGWLGGAAVAGLSISLNTFFLTLAVGQAVGTGGRALLAQAYGRGERANVPHIFQQTLWLTMGVGVTLWALAFVFAERYVAAFTSDPDVIREGTAFFRIYSATFLIQLILMAFSFCYQAVGDFMTPTYIFAGSLLINLCLDPLLMFGLGPFPRLGLAGAGYATVFSQVVGLGAYAWQIFGSRRGHILVVRRPFTLDWGVMWQLVRIGAPSGLQYLLFTAVLMITYRYVGPFGGDATAAVGIGFRVVQSAVMPCVAVGVAVASLVGQNYGARQYGRVKSAMLWGLVYAGGIATFECAVLMLFPRFWVSLFASDAEILRIGALYMVIGSLVLPPNAMGLIATFASQGLGRTLAPLLAVVVRVGYFVTALQVIGHVWGITLTRIFWASVSATVADFLAMSAVMAFLWLRVLREPAPGPAPAGQPAPEAVG